MAMATRLLTDLHKMSQHQLNAIRKEELIQSIMNAAEPADDEHLTLQEQLKSLIEEVSELKKVLTSPNSIINKKIQDLQDQVNKQQEIIAKQQRYLEALDRKERECNLVLLGVPDGSESMDGAMTDETKIKKVWTAIGSSNAVTSSRRLGREGGRRRPILITVASRNDRDFVLERAKRLKDAGDAYKKDLH
ncbi:uncharacterized protein LOC135107103 [Scylla paramamosain]|uniref:uncharacterized protein LOC135107103 n=1 Tax=Scylla paramamosain TaxID=85552 RepID=UPI003083E59B